MEKMTLNTNTVPVPQTSGPRTYEIPINVTPKAFEGLRRQGMSFHPVSYTHLDVYKRQGRGRSCAEEAAGIRYDGR